MNAKRTWGQYGGIGLLFVSMILMTMSSVLAQMISNNYQIRTSVLTNGGGRKGSANYGIQNSIGQPTPSGLSISPNYGLYAGFQPMTFSEFPDWVPHILLSVDVLDFGNVWLESSSDSVLTINNEGLGALEVASISTDDPQFSCSHESMSIPGLSSADLTVTFTPMAVDTFEATLTLLCNDADHPEMHISLYGIGAEGCQGDVGDVIADGSINVLDVLAVVNEILGIVPLDEFGLCRADCKPDGTINVLDALNIVNIILGIIPECPNENAKTIITDETITFLEALRPHFPADRFEEFMSLVKEVRVPEASSLSQNYPNPFNPVTDIRYQIVDCRFPIHTTLKIYNLLGQEVRVLVDEVKEPGYYSVIWDGKDESGLEVGSGVYFYRLAAGDFTEAKRMVLVR